MGVILAKVSFTFSLATLLLFIMITYLHFRIIPEEGKTYTWRLILFYLFFFSFFPAVYLPNCLLSRDGWMMYFQSTVAVLTKKKAIVIRRFELAVLERHGGNGNKQQ
ncbi:hypothetical protein F4775DRAFT_540544 [Biscogniauxia sp. FL1348]|nr:hypothetical protein F4775DRAFT_540544 [Biscogniauxia sp. FL1348]